MVKKTPNALPMSNSFLSVQYASPHASEHVCMCGKETFPDSIWKPIVKITLNAGTQGAQTWEYHLECVTKALAGVVFPKQDSGSWLQIKTLTGKVRHCLVLKTALQVGQQIVEVGWGNRRSVSVDYSAFVEALAVSPKPPACSAYAIVLEGLLHPEQYSKEMVVAKLGCMHRGYNETSYKKTLSEAIAALRKIENALLRIEPFTFSSPNVSELPWLYRGENVETSLSFREYLTHIFKNKIDHTTYLLKDLIGDRSQVRAPVNPADRNIKTALWHYMRAGKEMGKLRLDSSCWDKPLLAEIGNITLENVSGPWGVTMLNSEECFREIVNFLNKRNLDRVFEEVDLTEGLLSSSVSVRALCKAVHNKRRRSAA